MFTLFPTLNMKLCRGLELRNLADRPRPKCRIVLVSSQNPTSNTIKLIFAWFTSTRETIYSKNNVWCICWNSWSPNWKFWQPRGQPTAPSAWSSLSDLQLISNYSTTRQCSGRRRVLGGAVGGSAWPCMGRLSRRQQLLLVMGWLVSVTGMVKLLDKSESLAMTSVTQ